MKQHEAVIRVMEENGGYATLGFLYRQALSVAGVKWGTKTPFASIRRIVQDSRFFFKIRPGLWALNAYRNKLPPEIPVPGHRAKAANEHYDHTYFQGLLVELGNLERFETFVPRQDRNRVFLGRPLRDVASLCDMYRFTYDRLVKTAATVDVTWFNNRKMPAALFEVEHTTPMQGAMLKFLELQDFNTNLAIVADSVRQREFIAKLSLEAFTPINGRVKFLSYNDVAELHAKASEYAAIQSKLGLWGG